MSIEQRVKDVLVMHLGVDREKVTHNAYLIDDLGADSLDGIELMMAFEDEFGIELYDDAVERCHTVSDVLDVIREAVEA